MRENTHGSLHPPTHASSINSFFLKVKSNIQSSPLISKTVIYFSLFASIPLNVLLKLDEKVLFTSYDVIARFEWYRLFTSILYVNSGLFGVLFNAFISYRFISDFERHLGSFRCFFQLFLSLLLTNVWTLLFSVIFAPFFGGSLLSPVNISGPGVLSSTFAMCIGNIVRNSGNSNDTTTIFGIARVPNQWLPFVFLFFWYMLGNNLVEGCSCVFVALRYLPRMCGPSGVPSAVQAKRFESTTKIGRYLLEVNGYVDIDGLQRGFSLPVSTASGTNTVERASFSGKSQKVGSSSVNTSSIPPPRENVHVVRMREERERKQQQQQQQQQQHEEVQQRSAVENKRKEDVAKATIKKPETREERARLVAEAMEKRLEKEKEKKVDEEEGGVEQQQQQQQQQPKEGEASPTEQQTMKKKSKLRSPFRRGNKK